MVNLLLALILGLRHAFDPDHVVAVSTIADEKGRWAAVKVALTWALGHTLTLALIVIPLALLGIEMPEPIAVWLERLVGVMIVVLGFSAIRSALQLRRDTHRHGDKQHTHLSFKGRPHVHRRAFGVGSIHGLAGSGSMAALLAASAPTMAEKIGFLLLFGAGLAAAMGAATGVLSLAARVDGRFYRLGAGTVAVVFGLLYIVG